MAGGRKIQRYAIASTIGYLKMKSSYFSNLKVWISICLIAGVMACSPRPEGDLSSIPSTFTGSLDVLPRGRPTKDLYLAIMDLSKRYGMDPRGDGASDGRQWQIQIYCAKNYTGGGTTAGDGELFMFNLAIYGFLEAKDYERFKVEMVDLMKPYGTVRTDPERAHLSQEELLKRGKYTGFDVTSKCGPAVAAVKGN